MKRIIHIVLISLLFFLCAPTHAQEKELTVENSKYVQSNAEFLLIEAQKFFLLEDYKKTLAFLEQSIEVDGTNHAAFFKMAETHLILEDFELAQKAIDKAISLRQDIKYYYVLAAEIMKAKNNMPQAAAYYDLMVEYTTDYHAYTKTIADTYLAINDADKALSIYNSVENSKGLTKKQILGKVEALIQKNDLKDLENYLNLQIQKGNRDQIIEKTYVQTLIQSNKESLAMSYLNQLENIPEHLALLKYNLVGETSNQEAQEAVLISTIQDETVSIYLKTQLLGHYVMEHRNFQELLFADSLQSLINIAYPDDALAIQSSAMLNDMIGLKAPLTEKQRFYQKSIENYRKLVKLNPNDFRAWIKILDFERKKNLFEALEKDAEEALDLFPNQAVLYTYYAAAFAGQSNWEEANSLLQQAMRMSFGNEILQSLIYSEQAELSLLMKDIATAETYFDKAMNVKQVHPLALISFANYLLNTNPNKALETVEPFIAQGSKNTELFRIKTQALFNLGDYSVANNLWDMHLTQNITINTGSILELKGDILAKLNRIEEAVSYWVKAKSTGQASEKIDQKIENKSYQ